MRRLAAAALLLLAAAAPAYGDPVAADLSSHVIEIGSGFTGASVVLFGATLGSGDIIVVVRGPPHDVTVRRKTKIAGIWVNGQSVAFDHVPSYYAVAASRPIVELLPPSARARYHIGLANLALEAEPPATPQEAQRYGKALIADQQRAGLFAKTTGEITVLGGQLFRATLSFPANVPTGVYSVDILLVRDGAVVGERSTLLDVITVGINAALSDFSVEHSAAYGVVAVVMALMAGWLASLPFRGA